LCQRLGDNYQVIDLCFHGETITLVW
jgi:hypothetical protein